MKRKLKRGFAVIDPTRVIEIARQGGLAVSKDRGHMADIGRMGGMAIQKKLRKLMRMSMK